MPPVARPASTWKITASSVILVAQVRSPHGVVALDVGGRAREHYSSGLDEVGAVGEVEEGAATVGNVRDAQARDVLGAAAVDALTAKTDLALDLHHAAQGAQGRRLACAVRPEQGGDRLFLHCEADPVDHPRGAVGGVEPGYLEQHQPPR